MQQSDTTLKVFFDPSVKELIDSIALSFNVRITFFSVTRDEYLVGYHLQDSDFCSMIQTKLGIRYRCLALDTRMCAKCKRLGEKITYRCHAGLSEVIVPVYIEKQLMAFACLGQFRMSDDIPREMTEMWKEAGYPEEELRKAFYERPKYTEEQLKRILYIFSTSIEYLLSTARLKLRKPQLLEEILDYIDENIEKDITIGEVAEKTSKSTSTITHKVKETLGFSFKDLLIEKKLLHFEALMKKDPDMPIQEAAARVGYADPLYFSRLYRKKRGATPSSFQSDIRRSQELDRYDEMMEKKQG